MTKAQIEATLAKFHTAIENESDPLQKAYLQGVERALLEEYARARAEKGW